MPHTLCWQRQPLLQGVDTDVDFYQTWQEGPLQRWLGPLPRHLHGPSNAEFVVSRAALTRHPRQFWEEVRRGRTAAVAATAAARRRQPGGAQPSCLLDPLHCRCCSALLAGLAPAAPVRCCQSPVPLPRPPRPQMRDSLMSTPQLSFRPAIVLEW